MPLIPLDYIKTWYKKDSYVYKNFAYLFRNPLWKNNIPNGFSVCPFFWLSMFSLVIFRPIVNIVTGFAFTMKLIGLTKLIRWIDHKSDAFWDGRKDTLGFNTFRSIALLAVIGLLGCGICHCWNETHNYFKTANMNDIFWIGHLVPLSFIVSLFAALANNHERPPYSMPYRQAFWAISIAITILIGTLHPHEFIHVFVEVVRFLVWFIIGAWSKILIPVLSVLYVIPKYLGYLAGDMVVNAIEHWVALSVSLFIFIASAIISWKLGNTGKYVETYYVNARLLKLRAVIHDKLADIVSSQIHQEYGNSYGTETTVKARILKSKKIYDIICEIVDSLAWLKVDLNRLGLSISAARIKSIENTVINEYKINQITKKQVKYINIVFTAFAITFNLFKKTFLYRWPKYLLKQLLTFVCLIWELIKARKTGACPYLQFE